MKWEKLLTKLQIFVGRNWLFLMRMYKWENTVHDKKFSISLSVDASLLISLQVLAAYPSADGRPRAGHQEEPLDWRVRQSQSKRSSARGGAGEAPMAAWPECSPLAVARKQGVTEVKTNVQLLTVPQNPSHRSLPASTLTDAHPVSPPQPSLFGAEVDYAIS